jgi:glycosyltransferase involved in cell wall biosynthesis
MKICFFGTRMDLFSGHSRPAFELASALIDRGHEVRIISTSIAAERMARHQAAISRSPRLARIPVDRPFANLREMVRERRQSITTLQALLVDCDLLHGFSFNAVSMLTLLLPVQVPLVLSLSTDVRPAVGDYIRVLSQAPVYLREPRFAAGMLTPSFVLKRRLVQFGRIICWSGYVRGRLRSIGIPEAKIITLPPGIDRARFDLIERQTIRGSPVFLYAGLLSTLRGIPTLIRAFREVVQASPRARLVIADRGPHTPADVKIQAWEERRLARMIAESGLEGSVLLRRFEENLSSWFNACNAVVLPFSTTIGYAHPPLTMLEAMAHGLPVISTRIGSAPEYVEDGVTGILTDPGDAAGLASAMITLDPEAARQMGRNARNRADALREWSEIAAKTEAVYTDVLGSSDTPSAPV